MLINKKGYFKDENGEWWLEKKNGYRDKAQIYKCSRPECNNEFPRTTASARRWNNKIYCSNSCLGKMGKGRPSSSIGEKNHSWKGGKNKLKNGYIKIYKPNHPNNVQKYVLEHRLVMEEYIGRYLLPHETVHHRNGIRDDNRIENLELWTNKHPIGCRTEELIIYAIELLKIHSPEKLKMNANDES